MSNIKSYTTGDGKSNVTPSAYEINSCTLTSNSGKEYSIKDLLGTVEVVESLGQETIDVKLGIVDGIQFLESAIISGNERIKLKITHKSFDGQKKYDMSLRIAEITEYVRLKPGIVTYFFNCFSEHMYNNAIKKLVRPFEGSIGSIIEKIVKKDLKCQRIGTMNTETKGILKGIFPRLEPIEAINWLNRNAYDNQTPFYFTDTLAKGIIYDSYKNLCDAEIHREYIMMSTFLNRPGSKEYYEEMQKNVKRLTSTMDMAPLVNLDEGAYASTMHTLDYSDKSFNTFFYDYDSVSPKKLNKNKPFSDKAEVDGIPFTQTRDSMHHHISLNKNSFEGEFGNYSSPVEPTMLNAESIKSNMSTMGQTITVAGDYDITPGKKITLTLPKSMGVDATGTKDKFITGNYIRTKISHSFREEYDMTLELKKDSSLLDMNGESA